MRLKRLEAVGAGLIVAAAALFAGSLTSAAPTRSRGIETWFDNLWRPRTTLRGSSPPSPGSRAGKILGYLHYLQKSEFKLRGGKDRDADGILEYGDLDDLVANKNLCAGDLTPRDPGSREAGGYAFRIFVPEEPSDAERFWCAVAWPVDPSSRWPSYFVDHFGVVYEATKFPRGRTPALSDIYVGESYVSRVNTDLWREVRRLPR